jgi:hypothetical protein
VKAERTLPGRRRARRNVVWEGSTHSAPTERP